MWDRMRQGGEEKKEVSPVYQVHQGLSNKDKQGQKKPVLWFLHLKR